MTEGQQYGAIVDLLATCGLDVEHERVERVVNTLATSCHAAPGEVAEDLRAALVGETSNMRYYGIDVTLPEGETEAHRVRWRWRAIEEQSGAAS